MRSAARRKENIHRPVTFATPECPNRQFQFKMSAMAKKSGMSDSSLWIVTIVLLVLSAWMYFKK